MCAGVRVLSKRVVSPSRPGPTCLQQLNASQGQLSASRLLLRLASNLPILRSSFADLAVRDLPPRAGPTKESSRVFRAYLNRCAQPAGSVDQAVGANTTRTQAPFIRGGEAGRVRLCLGTVTEQCLASHSEIEENKSLVDG